ncbi:hypothetical protein J6590_064462 [Homalodisca vitripennis]|nr:hypothetical protein J6590_064462 [Homalodisca vitripennis]
MVSHLCVTYRVSRLGGVAKLTPGEIAMLTHTMVSHLCVTYRVSRLGGVAKTSNATVTPGEIAMLTRE